MKRFLLVCAALLLSAMTLFAGGGKEKVEVNTAADVENWIPQKSISFVVPFEAGGNSDIPARIFAKYMSKYSDAEISVTNIVGAGGRTGALEVMKADPDGYTIVMQPVAYPMQHSLGIATFSYEDFEMVGRWLDSSLAIVVNASSPYQTLDDLIEAARENPGKIKMGSKTQTLPLFAIMDLELKEDVQFLKVDLDQKAPELLSNRIDAYIDGFGSVKDYCISGDFRCLAIIASEDVPGFEDIPTYAELGYEDYEYLMQSFGMWAPKGTPKSACEYINNLIKLAAEDPECIAELTALGYTPTYMTIEEYTTAMAESYQKFEEIAELML